MSHRSYTSTTVCPAHSTSSRTTLTPSLPPPPPPHHPVILLSSFTDHPDHPLYLPSSLRAFSDSPAYSIITLFPPFLPVLSLPSAMNSPATANLLPNLPPASALEVTIRLRLQTDKLSCLEAWKRNIWKAESLSKLCCHELPCWSNY